MTIQEAQVIEAAKTLAFIEVDYQVNRKKEQCEKVAAGWAAHYEYRCTHSIHSVDYDPPEIGGSCWGQAVEDAQGSGEGWVQIYPDDTWCDACRHNWQKKQDRRRIVNRRIGALRRLVNAVERLEAAQ